MYDFQLIQNKVALSGNLSQLTLAEVPCFESTEDREQHCYKNEWTLEIVLNRFRSKMKARKVKDYP